MKRTRILAIVLFLTILMIGSTAMAAGLGESPLSVTTVTASGIYYVALTGRDANAGSAAAPFRTIQHAINKVPSGSTIIVRSGTYNERIFISGKSGLSIKNNPGDRPVLSGTGFSSGYLVEIAASSNIVFSGFEVSRFKGPELEGMLIHKASKNIEISSCKIHDIGTTVTDGNAHVILAHGSSNTPLTNIIIKNNEIYNCATGRSESITMESNVDGFTIINNVIHDVTNIAIDAAGFYDNNVTAASLNQARNGLIANNLIYNLYCPYASCAAIYVDGGRNIIIERNTVHNSMYGIEVGCENAYDAVNPTVRAIVSGVIVRYNTVYNNSKIGISVGGYDGIRTGKVINSQIYNNILYKNTTELELSYCDNIVVSKNIFYSSGGGNYFIHNDSGNAATNLKSNKNVYFAERGTSYFKINSKYAASLSQWKVISGQDLNSLYGNPLFVNKNSYNFSLLAGSPAAGILTTMSTLPGPAGFTAQSAGYNSVRLAWAAIAGASGYQVYRAASSTGSYSLVADLGPASTSYFNGSLTTGTTYYYKVCAYRLVGVARLCGYFTAVRPARPVPAMPAYFTVARYNSTTIKLKWSAVSGASGYQVYRKTTASGTWQLINTTAGTSFSNSGLVTGQTCFYTVRAYRMVGKARVYGAFTAVKSAKP